MDKDKLNSFKAYLANKYNKDVSPIELYLNTPIQGSSRSNNKYGNGGNTDDPDDSEDNLIYPSRTPIDEIEVRKTIANEWPATANITYSLQPQPGFLLFVDNNGNPRGTIETILPNEGARDRSSIYARMGIPPEEMATLEENNRVWYGKPVLPDGGEKVYTNYPGLNTIVYNPDYTDKEAIKLDLLHAMHDDPLYEQLYNVYKTAVLNDKSFLYHDISPLSKLAIEKLLSGEWADSSKLSIDLMYEAADAENILKSVLDSYLRDLFFTGDHIQRLSAGYTAIPYNTLNNPNLTIAINNIRSYLENPPRPVTQERVPYDSEYTYFLNNPLVGGMMTKDNLFILNPYSSLSPQDKDAVARNESIRLFLKGKLLPFGLTEELMLNFGNYSPNENDIKSTIIARALSGDPSAGYLTREQEAYINSIAPLVNSMLINRLNILPEVLVSPESHALGGPLYNSSSPIESFRGGIKLPKVRY